MAVANSEASVEFCGQSALRGKRNGKLWPIISVSYTAAVNFSFKYPQKAAWTQFQTHKFSENPLAPGIESGTLLSVVMNAENKTREAL
jgi:hypothetical protein